MRLTAKRRRTAFAATAAALALTTTGCLGSDDGGGGGGESGGDDGEVEILATTDPLVFDGLKAKVEEEDEARVTGDLTLNGVTKPVTLEVDLRKAAAHPMTQKPAVGFVAEGEIKRSDFNLGMLAPAVSDEMEIRISVEAIKG